uniref:Uncharacterized protein n=2 Tax=Oryza TaxID=4527 RepID=A0A0E0DKU8_9ORYZ
MSARRLVGARVLADEQGEAGCSGRIEVARWSIICFLTAACRSIEKPCIACKEIKNDAINLTMPLLDHALNQLVGIGSSIY